jgi:hypothetical protein
MSVESVSLLSVEPHSLLTLVSVPQVSVESVSLASTEPAVLAPVESV